MEKLDRARLRAVLAACGLAESGDLLPNAPAWPGLQGLQDAPWIMDYIFITFFCMEGFEKDKHGAVDMKSRRRVWRCLEIACCTACLRG